MKFQLTLAALVAGMATSAAAAPPTGQQVFEQRCTVCHSLQPAPGKPDLGFVGEIESVNAELLDMFLDRGYIPVISPVGFGHDGSSYNINADVAAGEIAGACGAERLIFLTDVAGILDGQGNLISQIRKADLEALLGKTIKGGMHVKAQAIIGALDHGVKAVHIVDGRVPHSVVAELFPKTLPVLANLYSGVSGADTLNAPPGTAQLRRDPEETRFIYLGVFGLPTIQALLAFCRVGPRHALVDSVDDREEPPEGLSNFEVR